MKIEFLIITQPVVNLRKKPVEASPEYIHDDLQQTQLLYNEILLYQDENEEWYHVDALEQTKFTCQKGWHHYPGWVKKKSVLFIDKPPSLNAVVRSARATIMKDPAEMAQPVFAVSMGTRLTVQETRKGDYCKTVLSDGTEGWIKKDEINGLKIAVHAFRLRHDIIETVKRFINMPYLWGGRSSYMPDRIQGIMKAKDETTFHTATGVDCSGLVNLAYRVNNIEVPRDAHDQWIVAKKMVPEQCEPADLVFVSSEKTYDKITHVMMHLGGEKFIEASETGSVVSINTFKKKFGLTLHEAEKQGFIVNERRIYFGSILNSLEKNELC